MTFAPNHLNPLCPIHVRVQGGEGCLGFYCCSKLAFVQEYLSSLPPSPPPQKVVGFKYLAERDPSSHLTVSEDRYSAPPSRLLRFSLTSLHFIIIAAVMVTHYLPFLLPLPLFPPSPPLPSPPLPPTKVDPGQTCQGCGIKCSLSRMTR